MTVTYMTPDTPSGFKDLSVLVQSFSVLVFGGGRLRPQAPTNVM